MPRNPNVMGYSFPSNTRAVILLCVCVCVSFPPYAKLLFFVSVTNPSSFQLQPIIQELKEFLWLAENLKLKVTNYSRELYGPGGVAKPGNGGDDDGEEEDSEAIPSYQPRKRRHR